MTTIKDALFGNTPKYKGIVIILCIAAVYLGLVMLLDLWSSMSGHSTFSSEKQLAFAYLGMHELLAGPMIPVALWVLVVSGVRFYRNRFKADWTVLAGPIALNIIFGMMFYFDQIRIARTERHASMLEQAVKQEDQRHLREIVFDCAMFCGYAKDPAPLTWLISKAKTDADFNAIGRILKDEKVRINVRSNWLPDRRTPLETAIDRYSQQPTLATYILGLGPDYYHFPVRKASGDEMDSALIYAIRNHAPLRLIDYLLAKGANPESVLDETNAIESAKTVDYDEALASIRRAYPRLTIR